MGTNVEMKSKMGKIYDTFIFFNELDLLEIRLNILNEKVDYFVIVEANRTFTGIEKPLYYNENKKRFNDFSEKIINVTINDIPDSFDEIYRNYNDPLKNSILEDCRTTPNIPRNTEIQWLREFYQKECIKKGIIEADDDDFIFISDLDEIWDPNLEYDFSTEENIRLNQRVFTYYLNLESSENWYGTVGTKYKNLKNYSINHIRTPNRNQYRIIENAGWHFTFQGGENMIRKKIESYGHQEYNHDLIKNNIQRSIDNFSDVFGRGFTLSVNNSYLPKYVLDNIEKYKHLIK